MSGGRLPTLTLGLPSFGGAPGGDWRGLLDLARMADDAGIDRVVVTDHVVNGPHVDEYPWGRFPVGPDADWLEPLTVLAAVAAVTRRARLATGILVAALRPAALLAKTAATLDVLSGGRLDLGVGVGWQPAEFVAVGVDHAARGRILDDTMAACRALWERLPASFASPTVSFTDTYCAPRPAQPRLPVWFSGTLTARNLRRIVELGDGWIPIMGTTLDGIRGGAGRLAEAWSAAGRVGRPQVQAPLAPVRGAGGRFDAAATVAALPGLAAAGATDVHIHLRSVDARLDDPAGACRALAAACDAVAAD
ncbi:MAG TPA: TIGR03619 family F420-dependent LLM class oxidoreductase [Acidimicrobiales bacterium]